MADALKVGDLVWAKMKGFSPWPGRVSNPTKDLKKPASKKSNIHCIFFFGTNNYAWIEENNIKPYFEYKEQLMKSSKSGPFKEAVEAIENFIRKKGDSVDDGSDPDAEFNRLRESVQQDTEAAAAAAAALEEGASTSTATPKVRQKKAASRKKTQKPRSVGHQASRKSAPPVKGSKRAAPSATPTIQPVQVEAEVEELTSEQLALQRELSLTVASFDTWGRLHIGNTSFKLSSKNEKFSGKEVKSTLYSDCEYVTQKKAKLSYHKTDVLKIKSKSKKSCSKSQRKSKNTNKEQKKKRKRLQELEPVIKSKKVKFENLIQSNNEEWYLENHRVMIFYLEREFEGAVHSFKSLESLGPHAAMLASSRKIKGLPTRKRKRPVIDENVDPQHFHYVEQENWHDSSSTESCSSVSDEELMFYEYKQEPTAGVFETMDLFGSLSLVATDVESLSLSDKTDNVSQQVCDVELPVLVQAADSSQASSSVKYTDLYITPKSECPTLLQCLVSESPKDEENLDISPISCAITPILMLEQPVPELSANSETTNIQASVSPVDVNNASVTLNI